MTVLAGSIGSASGITAWTMDLQINAGERHGFNQHLVWQTSASTDRYRASYGGEFLDTTPRQGIKFFFSSGNITGWYEVIGHLKQ